jgi:hypothetical protein
LELPEGGYHEDTKSTATIATIATSIKENNRFPEGEAVIGKA